MKTTYTHRNGNDYNVNINNGIVYLTSDLNNICPLQISLENFSKLVNIDDYLNNNSVIVKGVRGADIDVKIGSKLVLIYKYRAIEATVLKNFKNKVLVRFNGLEKGVMEATISHSQIHKNI